MASQYPPIASDEVDEVIDEEEGDVESGDLDDAEVEASRKSQSDELPEDFGIVARQKLRAELNAQVEAFLARGGRILEVPSNFNSSRPQKTVSDYSEQTM